MSESICNNCRKSRPPWSDSLKEQGYVGCVILLLDKYNYKSDAELYSILELIQAKEVATGWIKNGVMAINNQVLTINTIKCPEYEEK